jgi:glycine dehydrogenase subunit 1
MLAAINASDLEALFDEIPAELRSPGLKKVPSGVSEMEIGRIMRQRARQDGQLLNFCGAGAYEHHIPAAVWEITTRGEFYSAYTPYQAEASQGTLQLLYEFQSMMCALTGMEVSNASMYDGASALAEALLMAVRCNPDKPARRVLMPQTVHPFFRDAAKSITEAVGVELAPLAFDGNGVVAADSLKAHESQEITAVVIPMPNFFGRFEAVDLLTDWAHARGAIVVAVVNPLALGLIKPPSEWGAKGADIVCGDGQPMGSPLASGGPYFGFLTTKQTYVRQMPGRIVGRTVDIDGKPGYTLTLQAREQHIRRSKATSNICTNQGLLVTAATIHMSLLGPEGLARVAAQSIANLRSLEAALTSIPGVVSVFPGEGFHEAVVRLPVAVAPVLEKLAGKGILGGFDLGRYYPALGNALLICATETRSAADIRYYAEALREILNP